MTKTILTTLMVASLAFSSCKHALEPTELGSRNKILFASSRSGEEQLYVVNPDGSDIRQITSGPFWHNHGRWSPDAKQIICHTEEYTTTAGVEMVVINVDGTNRRYLGYGSQMSWSPDGQKIMFMHCPSCELGRIEAALYIIDSDGQSRMRLPVDGGAPAWSPDGKTIAFVEPNFADPVPQPLIKLMDYPGFGNLKSLGVGVTPAWAPHGQEIAYVSNTGGYPIRGHPTSNIFIMNVDGSNVRMITDFRTGEQCDSPRWSPDGNQIIFLTHATDGSQRHFLYSVSRDGFNLRRVLDDTTVTSADWSW